MRCLVLAAFLHAHRQEWPESPGAEAEALLALAAGAGVCPAGDGGNSIAGLVRWWGKEK